MELIEGRLIKIIKFLNPHEIIACLYSYIKVGCGSEVLF